jgi:hypothetical protein
MPVDVERLRELVASGQTIRSAAQQVGCSARWAITLLEQHDVPGRRHWSQITQREQQAILSHYRQGITSVQAISDLVEREWHGVRDVLDRAGAIRPIRTVTTCPTCGAKLRVSRCLRCTLTTAARQHNDAVKSTDT